MLKEEGRSHITQDTPKKNPDTMEKEFKEMEKTLENELKDLDKEFNYNDEMKSETKRIDDKFMNFKQKAEKSAYQRSMIFNWKTAVATLTIGGTCLLALFYIKNKRLAERERHMKQIAGKARIGGDWELINMKGELEGSEQLKGNWLLMYFGFTHCPDICPDEIEKMIKVVDILDSDSDKNEIPVKPIFISVDPERDTVARVKEYCAEFSPKLQGYTGSIEQVNKVAKTFRVYHSQGPKTTKDEYIVDHTVIMYLIDPDGNFHDYYGQNRNANEIANAIKMKVLKHQFQNRKTYLAQQAPKSEFVVKVPRKHELKRYSVLKFNSMDKVDTSKWSAESMLTLEREDNKGVMLSSQSIQEYGEGSEYGKAAREEARRKKYGRQARSYRLDNQPWLLTFNEPDGRERKMRSIREGGAGEHADYWVFLKMGEEFHAYKVCYNFQLSKALFFNALIYRRNKVMNQFALKAQIQSQLKNGDEDNEQIDSKATRSLKIKDEHSSDDSDADDERNDDNEKPKNKKDNKKKKANDRPKKDKRQRVENGDEVARYESSDGEDEGREYDYMSDSGSDSG
uniref:Transcription initiation factor IIF subunit alpha n=1 Tax=Heterorhabditis bacteriophora TaxID=37862 RepID=A0A1I7WRS4_HETBA